MNDLKELLKAKRVKPTHQRLVILNYLRNTKSHPSADTIYNKIIKDNPTMSRTTVYNTVNMLVKKDLVMPIYISANEVRFDGNTMPHHHFLCKKCANILDIDVQCTHFKAGEIYGNKIMEWHGYFVGICRDCMPGKNAGKTIERKKCCG